MRRYRQTTRGIPVSVCVSPSFRPTFGHETRMARDVRLLTRGLTLASLALIVAGRAAARAGRPAAHDERTASGRATRGDTRGSRYSPLDQIGADQLQLARGRVALQDRLARPSPRVQARGHAAGRRRRPLHDGRNEPRRRRARRGRPARRAGCIARTKDRAAPRRPASSPGAASRIGPTAAKNESSTSRPAIGSSRSTRRPARRFRASARTAPSISRPTSTRRSCPISSPAKSDSRARRSSAATSIVIGAAFREGTAPKSFKNNKGYVRGFDVRTGKRLWTFHTDSAEGRARLRHVAERLRRVHGEHRRVDAGHDRRRARARLSAGRVADRRLLRRASSGQRSLRREPRLSRPAHRREEVALPDRASSDLGLRSLRRADSRRHHRRRQSDQGRRRADQAGHSVRLRSSHRKAGVAVRGEAGREGRGAGRVVFADAADSDQAGRRTRRTARRSTT